jgi:hypothetical protein
MFLMPILGGRSNGEPCRADAHPTKPQPFWPEQARDELLRLWAGLDPEGRRIMLAHARAVADLTGRQPALPRELPASE